MFSTEFWLTSLIVVLVPGTGVIYTVSIGLFKGWRAALAAALGCTVGLIPHLLAGILGLSFILHLSAAVFQVLKFAGVAYMLYLAWMMWRDTGELRFDAQPLDNYTLDGYGQLARKAVLINLLNPKLTLFFFAFLPLFVSQEEQARLDMLLLSLIFMLLTLFVFALYGILASAVRRYVVASPKLILWLKRSFAVAFAALGLRLALTELEF